MGRCIRLLLVGVALACAITAAVLATMLAAPGWASAQTNAERITSYDARVTIQRNGSILVTEQITYDFGTDRRHGIFRVIPVRVRYNGRYDRIYPIDVRTVGADTPDYGYSVDSSGSSISIKIGNPDLTVSGVHAYVIDTGIHIGHTAFGGSFDRYLAAWVRSHFAHIATVRDAATSPTLDVWSRRAP